ncbi:MAG: hypothetical protein AAAFM81_10025, partial [Pseudomonadota bacterium]
MSTFRAVTLTCLVVLASMLIATFAESDEVAAEGMHIAFDAVENDEGHCTPKRVVRAFIGDTNLYAVRGETRFVMPGGVTEIPFQAVFRGFDDAGYSKDRATSLLNHPGRCDELSIVITIEFCEYYGDSGRERRQCPAIAMSGDDAFSSVQVIRE